MSAAEVGQLVLADATGVWAIRSESDTVYFVDTGACELLRRTGPLSPRGPGDDRWVRLVDVEALTAHGHGVIRVGARHCYLYDYDPEAADFGWWIQRSVTVIEPVDDDDLAALPPRRVRDPR